MSQIPTVTPAVPPGVVCFGCGYNLAGLNPSGVCPECGVPVSRSMGEDVLANSDLEYLRTLHRGVVLVLTGIILSLLMMIALFIMGFAGVSAIEMIATLLSVPIALLSLAGWWMFSQPDVVLRVHKGESARKLVRAALVVQLVVTAIDTILEFTSSAYAAASGPGGDPAWVLVVGVLSLAAFAAWALQFFASMVYLRWLAPRIPDERVFKRAKLLMWLGPVLMTVGVLLIGLGPLIALVLYYNLLNWVRIDLSGIIKQRGG